MEEEEQEEEEEDTLVEITDTLLNDALLTDNNSNYNGDLCAANYVGWYARRECLDY